MVKYTSYANNPDVWLQQIKDSRGAAQIDILRQAIHFYNANQKPLLEKGIDIADILLTMGLDNETLAATILYPLVQNEAIDLDTITDHFGMSSRKLLHDVLQMRSLGQLQHLQQRAHQQIENLRKMLLAMVTDVRAVLIVLAERLWLLRKVKTQEQTAQKQLAQETMDVFAPLANRLGVWHLKWEMEDLCLRYLQPDVYASIAKYLASRRQERESYNQEMIATLTEMLKEAHIKKFTVTGRVKHIYSIYKKMMRKDAKIEQIYDISALRVLLPSIVDCYTVLGLIQNKWDQVPEEFDDYISQPKSNGYQSIHTVIITNENRFNEIQIRTYEMHDQSELGVAAHWRYKEGVLQPSSYETKIALLRQIMAWQKEIVTADTDADKTEVHAQQDLLSDRVYVFTPLGDIIDLPQNATPLDFAYHVHSELGHRCRGAKVNGNIVPLTYQLKTGERVEVITAKEAQPSRDWLNPHYGYLMTPRARAKAAHWFRVRDSLQATNVDKEQKEQHPIKESVKPILPIISEPIKSRGPSVSGMQISGVDNLLTKIARCCKPLPGDQVIGYITQSRGVSIHRKDCKNLSNLDKQSERLIEVDWGKGKIAAYPVDLQVIAYDRAGLLRDITAMLASEKLILTGLNTTQTGANIQEAVIYLTIEISSMAQLNKAIELLSAIPNVLDVRRR